MHDNKLKIYFELPRIVYRCLVFNMYRIQAFSEWFLPQSQVSSEIHNQTARVKLICIYAKLADGKTSMKEELKTTDILTQWFDWKCQWNLFYWSRMQLAYVRSLQQRNISCAITETESHIKGWAAYHWSSYTNIILKFLIVLSEEEYTILKEKCWEDLAEEP